DMQVRAVHHADEAGVVVTASVDPAEVHAARVSWDGAVEWLTSGPGVHGVAVGGDTAVHISRSMDRPGRRCAVRSAHQEGPDLLIQSHAAEPGLELNVEILELGPRRLMSALVLPAGQAGDGDASLPVLLDPYGGPHAQRVQRAEALFHTSQWFADQGFAVLVADGRGTPGRGPAFERTVRGDLAGPVLDDQIDALEAAARLNPRLDLTRTAIRGWSFGGYLAALAVLRRPDVFSAAIAGAPVTDWRLYDTHYTERYLGHPAEEPGNYERTDLTPLASGLERPLMLVHGLADDNVVAAHTLRLSQALTEAGRPHTVLPLSGVTHMTPQEEVAENLLLIQLRFLQDALGMPVLAPREQPPRDNEGAAGE
ncbi:MAG: S9 family peptidase, partial [Acidimicrobiaceae bacterium]|nr:S9 family peptidase [Acidimicrobiaceae bacterium]